MKSVQKCKYFLFFLLSFFVKNCSCYIYTKSKTSFAVSNYRSFESINEKVALFSKNQGGPNKNKPSEFFDDFGALQSEIQCYLKDREKVQPTDEENSKINPLLTFFSLDEENFSSTKEKKIKQKPRDILSYSELNKYGYNYLVDPISKQGGYIKLSKKLGIVIEFEEPVSYDPKIVDIEEDLKKQEEEENRKAGLSLGSALESKLSKINEVDWKLAQSKVLAAQNQMAQKSQFKEMQPLVYVSAAPSKDEEVMEAIDPQPFHLNGTQRLYVLVFSLLSSLAHGKASSELQSLVTYISPEMIENLRVASLALLASSLLSASLSSYCAYKKQRNVLLWGLKGFIGGPFSLMEIKNADSWKVDMEFKEKSK